MIKIHKVVIVSVGAGMWPSLHWASCHYCLLLWSHAWWSHLWWSLRQVGQEVDHAFLSLQPVSHWYWSPLCSETRCLHGSPLCPGYCNTGSPMCQLQYDHGAVLSSLQNIGRMCSWSFLGSRYNCSCDAAFLCFSVGRELKTMQFNEAALGFLQPWIEFSW